MTTKPFSEVASLRNAHHQGVDRTLTAQDRPTATTLSREEASRSLPLRFDAKIGPPTDTGCWLWRGYVDRAGYGLVRHGGKKTTPHRAVYEILVGPVGAEDVDHLCRVRNCVNPAHLEPVSHRENMRRGTGFAGVNAAKTHCKRGHEFTPENTIRTRRGNRNCRECLALRRPNQTGRRRLTPAGLAEIRFMLAGGVRRVDIAALVGVSKSCISHIAQGKRHAEVAS